MAWAVEHSSIGTVVTQSAYGDSSIQLVTNQAVASGGTVVLFVSNYFSSSVSSVSDNGPGLTWAVTKKTGTIDTNQQVAVCYAYASAGMASGTTITVTFTGSDTTAIIVGGSSFSGGDASSYDATGALGEAAEAAGTSVVSGAVDTAAAGELVVGIFNGISGNYLTSASSPSVLLFEDHSIGATIGALYKVAGAAGSYTLAATQDWAGPWGSFAISMEPGIAAVNATVAPSAAPGTAAVVAPPRPRPAHPYSEINLRM